MGCNSSTGQAWSFTPPKHIRILRRLPMEILKSVNNFHMSRDELDRQLMSSLIHKKFNELKNRKPEMTKAEIDSEMGSYCKGIWATLEMMTELQSAESSTKDVQVGTDLDLWYEINTSNAAIFEHLSLRGIDELLPGRLFTTRMPRDITKDPEAAKNFSQKVKVNKLNTVLILTESHEFIKYAGAALDAFYKTLGLEVIQRPIIDYTIPNQADILADIKDITWRLSEGKNCLIHCAGGNGRTGMVVAAIMKNAGHKSPIAWIRRVKSKYVETREQEAFVENIPTVLDAALVAKHPILTRAIAAEKIIDLMIAPQPHHIDHSKNTRYAVTPELERDFAAAFDMFDVNKNGILEADELEYQFRYLGADVELEVFKNFFTIVRAHGGMTKDKFRDIMMNMNEPYAISLKGLQDSMPSCFNFNIW